MGLYAEAGDYSQLSNLLPRHDGKQLVRLPAWSGPVATDTGGLTDARGAFYDADNDRIVLVGSDGSSNLACDSLDSSWALQGKTTLHTAPTNLGGASQRNVLWYGGRLWLIGSNGKVYSGSSYTPVKLRDRARLATLSSAWRRRYRNRLELRSCRRRLPSSLPVRAAKWEATESGCSTRCGSQ